MIQVIIIMNKLIISWCYTWRVPGKAKWVNFKSFYFFFSWSCVNVRHTYMYNCSSVLSCALYLHSKERIKRMRIRMRKRKRRRRRRRRRWRDDDDEVMLKQEKELQKHRLSVIISLNVICKKKFFYQKIKNGF